MTRPRSVVSLRVNGHTRELYLRDGDTLLDVLREELGLTASKRGCDLGTCGCCTVQVDGEPILSCLVLAADLEGADIRTVEALPDGERFAPLQQAWAEAGASQCGFCTTGFLMTADALLRGNESPNREEIKAALAGNLCRCTGYIKIYEAVEACAARHREMRRQVAETGGNA